MIDRLAVNACDMSDMPASTSICAAALLHPVGGFAAVHCMSLLHRQPRQTCTTNVDCEFPYSSSMQM